MKTARQAGWSMTYSKVDYAFVTLSNDYGDYLEVYLDDDGNVVLCDPDGRGITLLDLPLSVLRLIALWFGDIHFVALALKEGMQK